MASPHNPPTPEEIAAARADLEKDLEFSTLLPVFEAGDPAKVAAVLEMIADGTIWQGCFFQVHPYLTETGSATNKTIPKVISLLDEVIDAYAGPRPDLSNFAEGRGQPTRTAGERLSAEMTTLLALHEACRSKKAASAIQSAGEDPVRLAKGWRILARRSASLSPDDCSDEILSMLFAGLKTVADLPDSELRAECVKLSEQSAGLFEDQQQRQAFENAVYFINHPLDVWWVTPQFRLLRECALCLVHLSKGEALERINHLLERRGTPESGYNEIPKGINDALGLDHGSVEKWNDRRCLRTELEKHLQARKGQ